ncbi:MAG: T9SS type A sorting domain-containing protein [Bacteroidota bacterium]
MKKLIVSFFTLVLCLSVSSLVQAQAEDLIQRCGGKKSFTRTYSSPQCYPKSDYPTREDAKKQLFEDVGGSAGFVCKTDSCINETDFTCEVDEIKLVRGNFSDKEDEWCTATNRIEIKWTCTNCRRKPKPDADTDPEGDVPPGEEGEGSGTDGLGHDGSAIHQFSSGAIQPTPNELGRITNISPNPSSGLFNVKVLNEYEDGRLDLIATDLTGKVLRRKTYDSISASTFHSRIDLSDFQAGIYLLAVHLNGKPIGTSKVVVQR